MLTITDGIFLNIISNGTFRGPSFNLQGRGWSFCSGQMINFGLEGRGEVKLGGGGGVVKREGPLKIKSTVLHVYLGKLLKYFLFI